MRFWGLAGESGNESLDFGQMLYFTLPSDVTCVTYEVRSDDRTKGFTSFVMKQTSFNAWKANEFTGVYIFYEGSKCDSTYYCKQQVTPMAAGGNVVVIMNTDHLMSSVDIVYDVQDCSSVLGNMFNAAPTRAVYPALAAAFLAMMAALVF